MSHSIHNIDISKPLTHMTPYTLSAICPVQWKPAFTHSSRLRRRTAVRSRPDEDDEHADELPWDGFWQFVQKFFGYSNRLLQQLSGWLVSHDLGGGDAGCGGPGLVWLHMVCGCEAGWMYCQILWNTFGQMNIQFMGNSSGGHSCSHHANCTLPQNLQNLWHCAVW